MRYREHKEMRLDFGGVHPSKVEVIGIVGYAHYMKFEFDGEFFDAVMSGEFEPDNQTSFIDDNVAAYNITTEDADDPMRFVLSPTEDYTGLLLSVQVGERTKTDYGYTTTYDGAVKVKLDSYELRFLGLADIEDVEDED